MGRYYRNNKTTHMSHFYGKIINFSFLYDFRAFLLFLLFLLSQCLLFVITFDVFSFYFMDKNCSVFFFYYLKHEIFLDVISARGRKFYIKTRQRHKIEINSIYFFNFSFAYEMKYFPLTNSTI